MTEWLWPRGCQGAAVRDQLRWLRSRWRTASLAAGWPFPSDWASAAVDRVCEAVVTGGDVQARLGELGAERAEAGVGLSETLHDLAALHAVCTDTAGHGGLVSADADAVPACMVRVIALGWAEVVTDMAVAHEVQDALTGLTTASYLRTRLHEVYREARAWGSDPDASYVLVMVTLDVPEGAREWSRMMAMVLAADVLRTVFDSGEALSLLRPSTAAVLSRRCGQVFARCERARSLIDQRIASDPHFRKAGPVRIYQQRLPDDHVSACELLSGL